MRRYLDPVMLSQVIRGVWRITAGGGPRSLRVAGISQPQGWLLPSSTVRLDLVARNGAKARLEPEVPLPLPATYAYRLARRLGVPVIRDFDPERFEISLGR